MTFALTAHAATITINSNLPGPNASSTGVGGLIANFYNFALIIAGILAFGAIVWGGIKYATSGGNPSAQTEGKSWVTNALLGLLLLAGAWIILFTINPQIVKLPSGFGLPTLTAVTTTGGGGTGGGGTGGGGTPTSTPPMSGCVAPTTGPCTVANLQTTCLATKADVFAKTCGHESGGVASLKSGTDNCLDPSGTPRPVSVGLFQINLTNSWKAPVDGQSCASAFQGQAISCTKANNWVCTTGSNGSGSPCKIVNVQLYMDCVAAAQNGAANIAAACTLSNNGANTNAWVHECGQ